MFPLCLFHFLVFVAWISDLVGSPYPRCPKVLDFWQWAWPLVKQWISAKVGTWLQWWRGQWGLRTLNEWMRVTGRSPVWGSGTDFISGTAGSLCLSSPIFFWLAWFGLAFPNGVAYTWTAVLTAVACTCSSDWCDMLLNSRIPPVLGLEAQQQGQTALGSELDLLGLSLGSGVVPWAGGPLTCSSDWGVLHLSSGWLSFK